MMPHTETSLCRIQWQDVPFVRAAPRGRPRRNRRRNTVQEVLKDISGILPEFFLQIVAPDFLKSYQDPCASNELLRFDASKLRIVGSHVFPHCSSNANMLLFLFFGEDSRLNRQVHQERNTRNQCSGLRLHKKFANWNRNISHRQKNHVWPPEVPKRVKPSKQIKRNHQETILVRSSNFSGTDPECPRARGHQHWMNN